MDKLHEENARNARPLMGEFAHDIERSIDRIEDEVRLLRELVASMFREASRHRGEG
jgi:archaellum component FlaC